MQTIHEISGGGLGLGYCTTPFDPCVLQGGTCSRGSIFSDSIVRGLILGCFETTLLVTIAVY